VGLKMSLCRECIKIIPESKTKDDILVEISKLAVKSSILTSYEPGVIYNLLKEREKLGSTGIGKSIAIPHCSIEGLEGFIVGVVISEQGLDFDSVDGKPANLIFFIIGPTEKRNEHIQILSSISKLGKSDEIIKTIKSETSTDRIYARQCRNVRRNGTQRCN